MKKWLIGVPVVLILLMGLLYAVYLGAAREPELSVDEASPVEPAPAPPSSQPDLDAIAAEKAALERELAAARRELTGLRMNAADESEVVEAPEPDPESEAPASFMESLASMMDSPDMQDMMKVQSRMALDQSHGELIRGLELTPDVETELKDLLVKRNFTAMTTGLQAMRGESVEGEALKDSMEAANEDIRALLGDEDYALFERFEETQTERMQVDMFKERLHGDLELDWETQDRLIEAMADARLAAPTSPAFESMQSGDGMPNAETLKGVVEYMEGVNELYLQEAAAILNQEQFSVFEESLEQYSNMQRAGLKMAEAMFGNRDDSAEEE